MGGAYGTPCSGELRFWDVMQAQMREQSKQLERIATALEAGHAHEERQPTVDCAALRETVDDIIALINEWHTAGGLEYWQSSRLFDALDSILARLPEGGAK